MPTRCSSAHATATASSWDALAWTFVLEPNALAWTFVLEPNYWRLRILRGCKWIALAIIKYSFYDIQFPIDYGRDLHRAYSTGLPLELRHSNYMCIHRHLKNRPYFRPCKNRESCPSFALHYSSAFTWLGMEQESTKDHVRFFSRFTTDINRST